MLATGPPRIYFVSKCEFFEESLPVNTFRSVLRSSPIIITAVYVTVSLLWIFFSDRAVLSIWDDVDTVTRVQSAKGVFFVLVSALLIYTLINQSNQILGQLHEKLERSRNRFVATFEQVPVGVFRQQPGGNWKQVNRSLATMLGFSVRDLLAMDHEGVFDPEAIPHCKALDNRLTEQEITHYHTELDYIRKDGERRHGLLTKTRVIDEDGVPDFIGALEDISELKEKEQALKSGLAEKEILLAELHHRVKNNLAQIASLLELQRMHEPGSALDLHLQRYSRRLKSLALIYESFQSEQGKVVIRFDECLHRLLELYHTTQATPGHIQPHLSEVELDVSQAIPFMLACNELLMVGLKSPHSESGGHAKLSLTHSDGRVELSLVEKQSRAKEESEIANENGFSRIIVDTLAMQLNADFRVNGSGEDVEIRFSFTAQPSPPGDQ